MSRTGDVTSMQKRAWGYYGYPGYEQHAVGEVRYVTGWIADQITRLDWDVFIDGSEVWEVELPDGGGTIRTNDSEGETDTTTASAELLDLVDWTERNVRAITTNLFVPGQGDYVETDQGWEVVSTIDPDRKKKLDSRTVVPFIWPHPADPNKPDAPLFSVLELLDELDWLNRQARTQSRQRVLISGIAAVADGFEGVDGETFWTTWNKSLQARMNDAEDLSPIQLSGPLELVKDGINWIVPPLGYDSVIDRRVLAAIHRLAYGLPVPPEILLGMQAQSRATAFQVEENAYRAHIEPPASMVAKVAADALRVLLDNTDVEVVANPSRLLARRNSVQDVKDAYDRGLVTPDYVREVLGIPDDAAPEPDVDGVPPGGSVPPGGVDPANVAADAPVTAAASGEDLSQLLADVDAHLSSELAGATTMATDRARQRLGAAARANQTVRNNPDLKGLTSAALAVRLGVQGLEAAGVNLVDQISEPVDSASRWWVRRLGEAWEQVATLIPGWQGQGDWVSNSVDVLAGALAEHVVTTLDTPDSVPLAAGDIRSVLDAAAGGVVDGVR